MSLIELLNEAEERLAKAGVESARLDAEVILSHVLGRERVDLYLDRASEPGDEAKQRFLEGIERRAAGCPVAYITGVKEFWSIPIRVSNDVLIPRPETELVVEEALKVAAAIGREGRIRILDLCSGSGCIAAALATELPRARFVLTDISDGALEVAKSNLAFAGGRAEFFRGDLFDALPSSDTSFDVIVTNPPYIPTGHRGMLGREITDHEPEVALFGGKSGLDFAARIIEYAPRFLLQGGAMSMEMGLGQSEKLEAMAREFGGYGRVEISKDLAGIERVITLWKS